ncbi:LysR substrate-binding domain-containing protein [Pseudochelatococcus contaminans]|uniref:DNA-binding transcriptional LysR family regulator n=1 Tax=Pseudochelatococcus contaminans TaxID=1538103 RepID=A0A7W5Z5Q2_9HYPH|nr:LysR substrate-binding domain-containing protein [Pseudochelatococcus contaminans]MBB3810655.1 DNA-binding transcriptional LysR family regulator [Pseudochelatococcus contaminans]
MRNLNDFLLFVQVVERGGFTAASRALKIPKSTLSHRVMHLETELGVRLLTRSSRYVGLTDVGRDFYRHAVAMLREAEMAETVVRQRISEPIGVVRCTASIATTQFALASIITDFLLKFPKVDIVCHSTNRDVDIVSENFDVAVRAHSDPLPDSNLVQRSLVTMEWHLFGGTTYLERYGEPTTPHDLQAHSALLMSRSSAPAAWHLRHVRDARAEYSAPISPRIASNDMLSLQRAAIMGLGIVALPSYVCHEAVQSGTLRRVLPEWTAGVGSMTALFPSRQGLLPSVRAFLDHLIAEVPKLALDNTGAQKFISNAMSTN